MRLGPISTVVHITAREQQGERLVFFEVTLHRLPSTRGSTQYVLIVCDGAWISCERSEQSFSRGGTGEQTKPNVPQPDFGNVPLSYCWAPIFVYTSPIYIGLDM